MPCAQGRIAIAGAALDVDAGESAVVVISAPVSVLIDFWAPRGPPCRVAGPIVQKVAAGLARKAFIPRVDVDRQPTLAAEFGVRAIPTFLMIQGREVVKQHPGLAEPRNHQTLVVPRNEEARLS
jgi:thioredoxin-like negative regulator of GroEL